MHSTQSIKLPQIGAFGNISPPLALKPKKSGRAFLAKCTMLLWRTLDILSKSFRICRNSETSRHSTPCRAAESTRPATVKMPPTTAQIWERHQDGHVGHAESTTLQKRQILQKSMYCVYIYIIHYMYNPLCIYI